MSTAARGPAAPERARTVLAACPLPEITADGAPGLVSLHVTGPDGTPVVLVPEGSALAAAGARDDVPVLLRAVQLRPLQVPDRVRARVEVHGRLGPVPPAEHATAMLRLARTGGVPVTTAVPEGLALLRVLPAQVTLDGAVVDVDAYRAARPDPFAHREAQLLRRLFGDRPDAVAGLCTLVDPALLAGATEIAPSGLDRHGITIMATAPRGLREARIPFDAPLTRVGALDEALQLLLDRARARRD